MTGTDLGLTPAVPGHWPPWPGRTVSVDGAAVYVRETPATTADAEPAVYLHGLGGSAQNWTDLAGLLADRLAGQALDLPGFGRSDPVGSCSVASVARRVVRWIEVSGRGPVHLLGNSFGGAVAVRVAAGWPELVRTLTLVSPAMPFLDARRTLHAPILPLLALPGVTRLAARRFRRTVPEDVARQVMEACYGDIARLRPHRFADAVAEVGIRYAQPHHSAVYVRTLRGLVWAFVRAYLPGAGSLWAMARRVRVPTLVVGGALDRIVDPRVAPKVAAAIPGARLSLLDGVGHVAQIDRKSVV